MWLAISLRNTWLRVVPVVAGALLATCGKPEPGGTRRFTIAGTVVERDEVRSRLTIAHEPVEGFMPAMTMPFRIANLQPAVQPGDKVRGTLVVMTDDGWIEDLRVTRKSDGKFIAPAAPVRAGEGVAVPEFVLRNQDGKATGFRQFRGQFVVATFIYTRCPFPDYCPLMMKNFNAVKRAVEREPALRGRVRLLSVTIDPEHDTPPVLRAYGERMIPGDDRFARWDLATGAPEEIRRMAGWFGLSYYYDSGQITHSLVTAAIGPDGRLLRLFPSNQWKAAEVVEIIFKNI